MSHIGAAVALAAVVAVVRVLFLWVKPYGKCRAIGCRGGRIAGSDEGAWGRCPRCQGRPVPRWGAAAVARLVGDRYGKRFW
jgi:hypothetical protein